jgi:hypothetical protein
VSVYKKNKELYQVMFGAMFQDKSGLWFMVIKSKLAWQDDLRSRSIRVDGKRN